MYANYRSGLDNLVESRKYGSLLYLEAILRRGNSNSSNDGLLFLRFFCFKFERMKYITEYRDLLYLYSKVKTLALVMSLISRADYIEAYLKKNLTTKNFTKLASDYLFNLEKTYYI